MPGGPGASGTTEGCQRCHVVTPPARTLRYGCARYSPVLGPPTVGNYPNARCGNRAFEDLPPQCTTPRPPTQPNSRTRRRRRIWRIVERSGDLAPGRVSRPPWGVPDGSTIMGPTERGRIHERDSSMSSSPQSSPPQVIKDFGAPKLGDRGRAGSSPADGPRINTWPGRRGVRASGVRMHAARLAPTARSAARAPADPREMSSQRRTTAGAKPLLSVSEAALLLGMDRSTLYRAIRNGDVEDLPTARVGRRMRIPRRAVERLVAGQAGDSAMDTVPIVPITGRCPTCGSDMMPSDANRMCEAPGLLSPGRGRHGVIARCASGGK